MKNKLRKIIFILLTIVLLGTLIACEKKDGKKVGSDKHGYITIPSTWVEFKDVNPAPNMLQYTNGNRGIITLVYFEGLDPQEGLGNLWAYHEGEGAQDIVGATVELKGEQSYQIHGYYQAEDIYIVIWMFERTDGYTQYICAEGPLNDISDVVKVVENTFEYKK